MLSRTAEGLFWLGRYIERAENTARLLEAARQIDQMPLSSPELGSEWSAILIAAGCRSTYPGDIERADGDSAIRHMIVDDKNPSSIRNCFEAARSNARAQRIALTIEVWSSINDAWREMREMTAADCCSGGELSRILERVRSLAAEFRGSITATQLRNAGFDFLRLGEAVERADATARLLDVKYHVLLPEALSVGGSYDQLQWNHILNAAGARSSYRWVYRAEVSAELVVDFLMLNRQFPRSFSYSFGGIVRRLERLCEAPARNQNALLQATAMKNSLERDSARLILYGGLHEYLTYKIERTIKLATTIGTDFGFESAAKQAGNQTQE